MTVPGLRIRPAHEDELDALTELVLASKRHWGYSEELLELWRDDLTIRPETVRRCAVFVAEREGERAGVAAVRTEAREAELEHLWVRPGAMGKGVGRRLFEHALGLARAAGAEVMMVVSDPNAQGFYERLGARRVDLVPSKPEGRVLPRLRIDL